MLHHRSSKQLALSFPSMQMPSSRALAMPHSLTCPQSCRLPQSPCAAPRQLPAVLLRVRRSSKLMLLSQQSTGLLRLQESRDRCLHLQSLACQPPGPGQSRAARHSVLLPQLQQRHPSIRLRMLPRLQQRHPSIRLRVLPRLQQRHPSIRLRMLLLLLLLMKIWQAAPLLPGSLNLLLLVRHAVLLKTWRALLLPSRLHQQQQG